MSMACDRLVWFCTEELPATSMDTPNDGMTAPPLASTSSVALARARHGASSAKAAKRSIFMSPPFLVRAAYTSRRAGRVTDSPQPKDRLDVVLVELLPVGLADRQLVRD